MRGNSSTTLKKIILLLFSSNIILTPVCDSKIVIKNRSSSISSKANNKIKHSQKQNDKPVIKSKISNLKQSKNKVENKINDVKKEITKEQNVQKNIKADIAKAEADIDKLTMSSHECKVKLDEQEKKIAELENRKKSKEDEIQTKKKHLGKCIRLIYTAKIPDVFEILFGASDFDDVLDKAQILISITNKISELIHDILEDIDNIKHAIKDIEILRSKYEETLEKYKIQQEEIKEKISRLDSLYEESKISQDSLEQELDTENSELKRIQGEIDSYYDAVRAQMEAARAAAAREAAARKAAARDSSRSSSASSSSVPCLPYSPSKSKNSSRLLWPVQGFTRISSTFTDTANRKHSHGAIDIASSYGPNGRQSIYGQPVRAPIDMVITYASYGYNGGYGNLITSAFEINGKYYVIYFGHLSGIVVSKGTFIKRGAVIGYVGNTGNSTGPHLHFEIRENGKRVDPLSFGFDY